MPSAIIPVKRFREHRIYDDASLLRVFGPALTERGFRLDLPWQRERNEESLIVTQEVPGRIPNSDPRLWPLLQAVGGGEAKAISRILGLLLAEGDDRAKTLGNLEVSMPFVEGDNGMVSADFGTQTDSHTDQMIPASKIAERLLCGKVLLLFGLREETL